MEVNQKRQLKGYIFVIFLIVFLEMKTLQSGRLWFVSYLEKSFQLQLESSGFGLGSQQVWSILVFEGFPLFGHKRPFLPFSPARRCQFQKCLHVFLLHRWPIFSWHPSLKLVNASLTLIQIQTKPLVCTWCWFCVSFCMQNGSWRIWSERSSTTGNHGGTVEQKNPEFKPPANRDEEENWCSDLKTEQIRF